MRQRPRIVVVLALGMLFGLLTASGGATGPAGAAVTKKRPVSKLPKKKAPTSVASTTVVPASAPPSTVPVQPLAQFKSCITSALECADVSVPLDPKNPAGERATLFVSRRKASGPAPRIGVLLVNPGGPGGPTYDLVRSAARYFTPEVLERFDVVGVDPRGTLRSAPLRCDTALIAPDSPSVGAVSLDANLRRYYEEFAKTCSTNDGDRLQFLDTETAARDMEAVRQALGEEQISYLGMSYGTYLGAVYRSLFPTHVRTMILDSAIDPNRFGVNQLLDTVIATEVALDGFLDECASGRLNPCNFNDGTDLRAKYLRVREEYVTGSRRGREGGEEIFDSTVSDLVGYPRNGWPILGRALQELATKQPVNFNPTPADSRSVDDSEKLVPLDRFSTATNFAINCRDGLLPRDPASYQTVRDQTPLVGPRFSGLRTDARLTYTCLTWPAPPAARVPLVPQIDATTLVIGNTFDLTTPYVWSQNLAASIGVTLLTRNGGGHVAIDKSACIRDAAARFLVDRTIPASGTICSPSLENPT